MHTCSCESIEGVSERPSCLAGGSMQAGFFTRRGICYATCESLLIMPNRLLLLATYQPVSMQIHIHSHMPPGQLSSHAWLHTQVALMGLRAVRDPPVLLFRPEPSCLLSPVSTCDCRGRRVRSKSQEVTKTHYGGNVFKLECNIALNKLTCLVLTM